MRCHFIKQHVNHIGMRHHAKRAGIELTRLAANFAQHIVAHGARGFDDTLALTHRARLTQQLCQ